MESRKRPHLDDGEPFQSKKRALASPNGTPYINGVVPDIEEPTDNDNLELFRKEAIFRRMKHYSREHERSKAQMQELERRKNTCEAGLAAMSACWTQLVDAIRLVARPEELPPVDANIRDIFDLTKHVSDDAPSHFTSTLKDNLHVTQSLVTKFLQLGGQNQPSPLRDESYIKCQRAQTECTTLRSELHLMRKKLRDTENLKDKLHSDLVAAEIRADRLLSPTVLAMQARAAVEKEEPKVEEKVEEPEQKLPSPPARSPSNDYGQHTPESDYWQELAKGREDKIVELEKDNAVLRDQINILQLDVKCPPLETLTESPHYKILLEHASRLEHTVDITRDELTAVKDELHQLQSTRKANEESYVREGATANQELRTLLAKRDNDLARLRDQREQQAAELNERKHKDSVKSASLQEWKLLAESRSDKITVLLSELARHKAQLAANAGKEDLLLFFFRDNEGGPSYIEDLKNRATAAESRATALEQTFAVYDDEHPDVILHMKAEADAREKLAEANERLQQYQSIYGDPSKLSPDIQVLEGQLRLKEDELQKLRLSDMQRAQAETSLYSELDKLSAAWEALDRQVKSKVFDLSAMEERLTKSGLDKAKSENKFYSAMRDKEAIETERRNISRNLEKQAKVIEKLAESEKSLSAQVIDLEKEVVLSRKALDVYKEKLFILEKESSEWQSRADGEKKRASETRLLMQEREKALGKEKTELRKMEEALSKAKKEMEKQQAVKAKVAPSGSASQREAELQSEVDKCMSILKCSTCKMQMRSTVITKCMHSFCKQCVDSRISTRQRKCPACNLPFSQSDVQQLYFQ